MSTKTKKILGVSIALLLIAAMVLVWAGFREKPTAGQKDITIQVVNKAQQTVSYQVSTNSQFLRQAMEEAEGLEFSGTESEFGLMVEIVNGEQAIYDKDGAYWGFTVNGEFCNYGIDQQPVENGDIFQIVYTPAA